MELSTQHFRGWQRGGGGGDHVSQRGKKTVSQLMCFKTAASRFSKMLILKTCLTCLPREYLIYVNYSL